MAGSAAEEIIELNDFNDSNRDADEELNDQDDKPFIDDEGDMDEEPDVKDHQALDMPESTDPGVKLSQELIQFHIIVVPSLVWATLAQMTHAIHDGSFKTLISLLESLYKNETPLALNPSYKLPKWIPCCQSQDSVDRNQIYNSFNSLKKKRLRYGCDDEDQINSLRNDVLTLLAKCFRDWEKVPSKIDDKACKMKVKQLVSKAVNQMKHWKCTDARTITDALVKDSLEILDQRVSFCSPLLAIIYNKFKDVIERSVFLDYHKMVFAPIVWAILDDIEKAIKNKSLNMLLKILQHLIKNIIPQQLMNTSIPAGSLEENPNKELTQLTENIEDEVSSFSRHSESDRIEKSFKALIQASELKEYFDVHVDDNPSNISCIRKAKECINASKQPLQAWCRRSDITELHKLVEQLQNVAEPQKVFLPSSVLQNAKAHPSLHIMLERADIFMPFLEIILTEFNAFNERVQPNLEYPLHFAVRNLDETFLEWLLQQKDLDINCRDRQKKTALFVLCEIYDEARECARNPWLQLIDLACYFMLWGLDKKALLYRDPLLESREFIKHLLSHKASFNICSIKPHLPYELLTNRKFDSDSSEQKKEEDFLNTCLTNVEILKKVDGKFVTENIDTWTIELFEILLHFNEEDLFIEKLKNLNVGENDIGKVITLLLHTAVEQNFEKAFHAIINQYGNQIFDAIGQHKYRVELKGLLFKACYNGNIDTLELLLHRMRSDKVLINDGNILVTTLNRCGELSDGDAGKTKLLSSAEWMASKPRIFNTGTDRDGNCALHAALTYNFMNIAKNLMDTGRGIREFLAVENKNGETPMDFATPEFYNEFLDECIKICVFSSEQIYIDLKGINPPTKRSTLEDTDGMKYTSMRYMKK